MVVLALLLLSFLIVKEMDRHLLIAPSIKIAVLKRLTICKA